MTISRPGATCSVNCKLGLFLVAIENNYGLEVSALAADAAAATRDDTLPSAKLTAHPPREASIAGYG